MSFHKQKHSHASVQVDSGYDDLISSDIQRKSIPSEYENKINVDIEQKQETEYFEWVDVNVSIGEKTILHKCSGRVGNGQLLGILGGSGAGKTTLLNAISGRILSKNPSAIAKIFKCLKNSKEIKVNGTVAYNNLSYKLGLSDDIKYISAYVMQHDIQCATSTGKEALLFSSKLRSILPMEQQLQTINNVIHSLKLEDCQNTRIGSEFISGMSGGERKRTSVGCELVVDPSLIFLDEPTSGLDSFTALKTLEILKTLVSSQNKKVIAVMHQPSSDIFAMLDLLIILAKGHCVYFGKAMDVIDYFNNLGFLCPQFSNPADYVINRVQENSELFIKAWKQNQHKYIDLSLISSYDELIPKRSQNSSFCTQAIELLRREWSILKRDPRPSKIRLAQTIIFSLVVGALYYQLPYTLTGMRNRFAVIFFLSINSSMTGLTATITTFPEQRLLYERERDNNMYYTTTYILAKCLVQIPEQALFVLIYELICYWMVGFDSSFIQVYISIILCTNCMSSIGMIAGCFANNTTEAMQFMPLALLPLILMSNFMVSTDQIPVWLRWFQWMDCFKYIVDAMSITEFQNQLHDCYYDIHGIKICLYDGNLYLKELDAGYMDNSFLKRWIKSYDDSVYFDWIMLIVLMVFFRLLTWIILVHRNGW